MYVTTSLAQYSEGILKIIQKMLSCGSNGTSDYLPRTFLLGCWTIYEKLTTDSNVASVAIIQGNRREETADRLMKWMSSTSLIPKRKDLMRSYAMLQLARDYSMYVQIL